jgi:hypothetical protein
LKTIKTKIACPGYDEQTKKNEQNYLPPTHNYNLRR